MDKNNKFLITIVLYQ